MKMNNTSKLWETTIHFSFNKTDAESYLRLYEKHPAQLGNLVLNKLKESYNEDIRQD